MKDTISNRLKRIMKERNWKQVDLLKKSLPFQKELNIKMGKSTLSQYVNGVQSPDQDRIYLLSKVLDVNEPWLMGYDVSKERVPDEQRGKNKSTLTQINEVSSKLKEERQTNVLNYAKNQYEEQNKITSLDEYKKECNLIEFPKIGATGAGIGEELYADIIEDTIEVYEDEVPDGADFCILINGDSMEPIFKKGSYAFIEKKHEAKNGQILLVLLEGSALIKKFETDCVSPKLVSLNPEYKDIYVETHHQFKVLGKVVM
jgi:SOS-response transcriptional repressor LexA